MDMDTHTHTQHRHETLKTILFLPKNTSGMRAHKRNNIVNIMGVVNEG